MTKDCTSCNYCGEVILADTEDLPKPLCYQCYENASLIAICLAYLRWFEDCDVCNGLGLINGVVIRHNEEFKNVDK